MKQQDRENHTVDHPGSTISVHTTTTYVLRCTRFTLKLPLRQGWFGDCLLRDRISNGAPVVWTIVQSKLYIYVHCKCKCRQSRTGLSAELPIGNDIAVGLHPSKRSMRWALISYVPVTIACAWDVGGWAWSDPCPPSPLPRCVWSAEYVRSSCLHTCIRSVFNVWLVMCKQSVSGFRVIT